MSNEDGDDLRVLVILEADTIVVTMPGTNYSISYRKLHDTPWLVSSGGDDRPFDGIGRLGRRSSSSVKWCLIVSASTAWQVSLDRDALGKLSNAPRGPAFGSCPLSQRSVTLAVQSQGLSVIAPGFPAVLGSSRD
jgi:hypothetical protein